MRSKLLAVLTLSVVLAFGVSGCSKNKKVWGDHRTGWKQKELIVTYSCSAPPTETTVENASKQAFNLIPNSQETLDLAAKHGMKIMLEHGRLTPAIADDKPKLDELSNVIRQVKNHTSLEGYYLFDEPKAADIPALAKMVAFIRERDPNHYCFINMLPIYGVPGYAVPLEPGVDPSKTYMKFVKNYIETVKPDILSYDFYAFHKKPNGDPIDTCGYFANLSLIREAAKAAQIPFINIIQACAFDNTFRTPNADEMRWQVYTTLAYGGRGVSYFLYWGPKKFGGIYQDGKEAPLLEPIVRLNQEMRSLSDELMQLTSEQVFNSEFAPANAKPMVVPPDSPVQIKSNGDFVLGLFSSNQSNSKSSGHSVDKSSDRSVGKSIDHFMLVNTNYREKWQAKFSVLGEKLEEFDRVQGKWFSVETKEPGEFELTISPGDGRLFRFGGIAM